jgi:FAD:protein FMN transferase
VSAERPTIRTVVGPAMGGEVRVTTDASAVAIRAALTVVARLEKRWSRFLPDSELSLANGGDGLVVVRPSTARIIEIALAGRRLTDGWFDPTRGAEIVATGYDRPLAEGWGRRRAAPSRHSTHDVVIDADSGLLSIPSGVALDLGGIAKGWTADLAAAVVYDNGADFVGVEVGGDIRVRSRHRAVVDIDSPDGDATFPMRVGLRDGGVAVSGPTRRRGPNGEHHLIDPFTGRPARRPRVAAVIAASAAGAEMLATAAAIAPLDTARAFLERAGATAWLVDADGEVAAIGEPERFLLDDGWLATSARREWAM